MKRDRTKYKNTYTRHLGLNEKASEIRKWNGTKKVHSEATKNRYKNKIKITKAI